MADKPPFVWRNNRFKLTLAVFDGICFPRGELKEARRPVNF
jgi:hypothetical protein